VSSTRQHVPRSSMRTRNSLSAAAGPKLGARS
jgi:hypothetical protein